ncbi:hypothetical protein IW143_003905 [Coemansia sp. RSA 520]|nr:hypothetical protein IW143_003905 [Coemansia sp. RSA 520]KAJ2426143.1 hypothetical protein IWW41_004185 [Coemansia sp. RSA 2522]
MYMSNSVRHTTRLSLYVREICATLEARRYSSTPTDTSKRHTEFATRFSSVVQSAHAVPLKPPVTDPAAASADTDLAHKLSMLFGKIHVEETPELLERREMLRNKYPEIFKDIL